MDKPEKVAFSAYAGIDWADSKHDVCIQSGIEGKREFAVIPHQAKDIGDWVQSLLHRFAAPIAIAVELSKADMGSGRELRIITLADDYSYDYSYCARV